MLFRVSLCNWVYVIFVSSFFTTLSLSLPLSVLCVCLSSSYFAVSFYENVPFIIYRLLYMIYIYITCYQGCQIEPDCSQRQSIRYSVYPATGADRLNNGSKGRCLGHPCNHQCR